MHFLILCASNVKIYKLYTTKQMNHDGKNRKTNMIVVKTVGHVYRRGCNILLQPLLFKHSMFVLFVAKLKASIKFTSL